MESTVIGVSSLVKHYGDLTAVDAVSFNVAKAECFGLLGPNGAGKTTTVEILEGLTVPTSGDVEILGMRWGRGRDHEIRLALGIQLQETRLEEKLTVEETLSLFSSFYPRGRTLDDLLSMVDLGSKRSSRVGKLSGGQRQRLALGCALVGEPEILFLDEPTTGLDPTARLAIWNVVEEFLAGGGTVLLTTHYMEEAERLCGRVAIMDAGRIVAVGPPGELVASLGEIPEARKGTLEDVFVSLTGRKLRDA